MRIPVFFFLAAVFLPAAGCATVAPFVWVDSLPASAVAESGEYLVGPGDLLSIQVWEQEKMSTKGRVRPDGKISIPLLHDVAVAGKTPAAVAADLEVALKPFMIKPLVNVVVDEPHPLTVSVLGQVSRPGQYVMTRGAGLAQVLASAGGPSVFARKDRIFVLRAAGEKQQRIRFRYDGLLQAATAATKFRVHDGDIVVVE